MGRPRTLDHDVVIDLYRKDHTPSEIASALGCSREGVMTVLRSHGVPRRAGHRKGTLDHVAVIADYESGLSLEQTATKNECSKAGVAHILRINKVPTRENAKRRDTANRLGYLPTAEWLEEQLATHGTAAEVARQNGIPYGTLISWMDRLDVAREVWRGGPGPTGNPVRQDIPFEEAVALSNSGTTYEELAQRYNVSYGVIMRRMKEVGHHPPPRRVKDARFPHVQGPKRKILQELGITECEICGETRVVDFCHIKPDKKGGPIAADNCLVLCPTHHRLYDRQNLSKAELKKIGLKVQRAVELYGDWR